MASKINNAHPCRVLLQILDLDVAERRFPIANYFEEANDLCLDVFSPTRPPAQEAISSVSKLAAGLEADELEVSSRRPTVRPEWIEAVNKRIPEMQRIRKGSPGSARWRKKLSLQDYRDSCKFIRGQRPEPEDAKQEIARTLGHFSS